MAQTAKKKSPAKPSKTAKHAGRKTVRRKGKSKAQAIRDAANELRHAADPAEIIAALATKGITVSSAQVNKTLKAAGLLKPHPATKMRARVTVEKVPSINRIQTFAITKLLQIKKLGSNFAARTNSKKCQERCSKCGSLIRLRNKSND